MFFKKIEQNYKQSMKKFFSGIFIRLHLIFHLLKYEK